MDLTSSEKLPPSGWRWKNFRNFSNMARIRAKLCQNAFRTFPDVSFFDAEKKISAEMSDQKFRFLLIWHGHWGAMTKRTSKSASSSNFALDRLIQRSVRPKNLGFGEIFGSPKIITPVAGGRSPRGIKSTASLFSTGFWIVLEDFWTVSDGFEPIRIVFKQFLDESSPRFF